MDTRPPGGRREAPKTQSLEGNVGSLTSYESQVPAPSKLHKQYTTAVKRRLCPAELSLAVQGDPWMRLPLSDPTGM